MVNDQHPHAGYAGDGAHSTDSFSTDPLFGTYAGGQADNSGQWDLGQYGGATGSYTTTGEYDLTGQYDNTTGQYDTTGAYATTGYDTTGQYGTGGQWDATGQWTGLASYDATGAYDTTGAYATTGYDTTGQYDATGQWNASAWTEAQQTGQYETVHAGAYAAQGAYGYESYDATGQWAAPAFATDNGTGSYDATAWNHATPETEPHVPQQYNPMDAPQAEHTAEFAFEYGAEAEPDGTSPTTDTTPDGDFVCEAELGTDYDTNVDTDFDADADLDADFDAAEGLGDRQAPEDAEHLPAADAPAVELRTDSPIAGRPVRRNAGGGRSRRRTPAKRSALLTVAVPSACVMGVAGIAAASVGGLTGATEGGKKDNTTTLAAADPASVKQVAANNALDTQLAALSEDARDFGDRASRTQERIDLRIRQEAEKKKREEEAARKEALRPKFSLPVKLHRLSARFGQSGINWMSVHTGIDFPVMTGTPVMAATDGTVRTQLNSAYGNMVIVTAPDGTETWYCHLSSAKIRSGQVKAGDVIAYSGDSGNSTGPHLHFEVRPNGTRAIDPLAWLRSHGLDPTS
ncbi:M23 family metallopeptidase [Streptomyces sp. NPDC093089]|uniref:M23 family metallopeptidase n=1 Tax=Streptomyces sp. NPDC093089 TaxID=3366024 RepID=UPI00382CE0CE